MNAAIDHLRQAGPKGTIQPLSAVPEAEAGPGPRGSHDVTELQRAFLRLAARLGAKQRAVFVLKEIEGRETAEIAAALGVTESTVRNHLHHARRILKEGIEREYPGLVPPGARKGSGS